jgi:hypothetical protein
MLAVANPLSSLWGTQHRKTEAKSEVGYAFLAEQSRAQGVETEATEV